MYRGLTGIVIIIDSPLTFFPFFSSIVFDIKQNCGRSIVCRLIRKFRSKLISKLMTEDRCNSSFLKKKEKKTFAPPVNTAFTAWLSQCVGRVLVIAEQRNTTGKQLAAYLVVK